ncbi:hypothetical protein KCP91_15860 [Microvirga sp. SRT01]|uniref:Uncharacterized protein n=1 Tax=Sphingomonas longa TaxID=2778730 RepID=A0ABS2DAA1_9SPHN|nr:MULTISPECIES: hypothetical protein [Alphaproteobacteria]MBM6577860.1 hypothetical protein [Sphingomonas sp. BT552]MBR7710901.1 hypothetical protein [Microvirga sp. SRT01]
MALFLTFGIGFLIGKDHAAANATQMPTYEFTSADQASEVVAQKGLVPPVRERRRPCTNPVGHDEADLCAQWRAAIAAERGAWAGEWSMRLTIVGSLLSGLGLIALVETLRQGRKALERARQANYIADNASRIGLRAYLAFNIEVLKVDLDGPKPTIDLKFLIRNTGQTPAKGFKVSRRLKIGDPFEAETFFRTKTWKPTQSRGLLGAGQEAVREKRYGISIGEARKIREGKRHIYFFGEAEYEDVFGNEQKLQFRRWMSKADLGHFNASPSGEAST